MTQEQFIQMLPAYMGCKVENSKGERGTLDAVYTVRAAEVKIVILSNNMYKPDHEVGEFKLVLRTFGQMTENEWSILSELMSGRETSDWRYAASFIFNLKFDKSRVVLRSSGGLTECAKSVNYLRSIGIDCDRLIEAGYAIKDENTF